MRDRATRNQQILGSEVKENLNTDSKYTKEFIISSGTELKLRKDRIQIVVNMFSANERPE
jgi:hypothetical protein